MGKKGLVSEVLQSRSIVSHHVVWSWDVLGNCTVAVEALVGALEVTQSRAWSFRHGGAFDEAADCRGVVCSNADGGIANVVVVGHDGKLSEDASMLQVAVGYIPGEVGGGYKTRLDFWRKRGLPYVSCSLRIVVDSSHSGLGSIGGSQKGRLLGNNLSQVSGSA